MRTSSIIDYEYEEGRIVRATESDINLNGEVVTSNAIVNNVKYYYDTEGKMTKKVITPASGSAQTIYYETNDDNTYTYDPHAKLSRLLCKKTNGVVTKLTSSNETQADVIIKCKCCKSTLAVKVAQDFFVIEHMSPPQRINQNNT